MRKNWKKKIDRLLSFVLIAILLPLFVTTIGQRMQLEELIYGETTARAAQSEEGTGDNALTESETATESVLTAQPDAETALIGIVAREIGVSAEEQAILAQCVIARTNLYDARAHGTAEPEALSIDEMRALWGADFEKMYRRMEDYVSRTKNQVLLWNGSCIYAAYHAISAGQTRDMKEIYDKADLPYLTEQPCQPDVTALGYLSVFYLDKETFLAECHRLFPECALEEITGIEIHSRDAAGYVKELTVGTETISGEEFRKRFGWNSACFSISEVDGRIRVVTKGLGHGFGLSQNTAENMASEGADYKEILSYFYPGTELRELSINHLK